MTDLFYFRWSDKTAGAEATQKTAMSISVSTTTIGLTAKCIQPFFYLERDL